MTISEERLRDHAEALERSLENEGGNINAYLRDDIEQAIETMRAVALSLRSDAHTNGEVKVAGDVESVARRIAAADGKDPDAKSHNSFEWWRHYVPHARAVGAWDRETIIDAVMESEKFAPKIIPMGAHPPLFDSMQPDNDGPWVSRVDVAKRLRAALNTSGEKP